jgi:SAM-dependent methyltransferase
MTDILPVQSCYLCGGKKIYKRNGKVRDNPNLEVLECKDCGLVFLSSFAHIKGGFYQESGMHERPLSIEEWSTETEADDDRRFYMLKNEIVGKSLLDFGCGNGGFLLRARDVASDVAGIEPESRLSEYFRQKGLTVKGALNELNGLFDYITLFHVLEHISDPVTTLRDLSRRLKRGGKIIIEVPNASDALLTLYECKAFSNFTYWSCHLFLFTEGTLLRIGEMAGLEPDYVRQVQRYSVANHLYWLSSGQPGGHKKWDFIESDSLRTAYEERLASIGCCDTIIASFLRGYE